MIRFTDLLLDRVPDSPVFSKNLIAASIDQGFMQQRRQSITQNPVASLVQSRAFITRASRPTRKLSVRPWK